MARYNSSSAVGAITGTGSIVTPDQGLYTTLAGTAPYTVTLADPADSVGRPQTFYNSTSGNVTLSSPSGNIVGPGFSASGSQIMPANSTYTLTSDGTGYVISNNEGGPQAASTLTVSSTLTAQGAVSLSPASQAVTISPSGTGTVAISPAGALTINPSTAGTINNIAIGNSVPSTGAFTTLSATGSISTSATSSITVASGSSAQRPSGVNGMIRYNTSTSDLEHYTSAGNRWHPITKSFGQVDVSSNVTASIWNCYWVNTSGGARTVTLPNSGLTKGDTIRFFDLTKTFDSNALTIARNGQLIQGDAADLTVTTEGAAFELVYHSGTYGWRIFTI